MSNSWRTEDGIMIDINDIEDTFRQYLDEWNPIDVEGEPFSAAEVLQEMHPERYEQLLAEFVHERYTCQQDEDGECYYYEMS